MSTEGWNEDYTIVAANDFRSLAFRVVDAAGDLAAAGALRALGIARTRANSGQNLGIVFIGVTKAITGAAITTPGYPLTTAASGYVTPAVSGSNVIGRYIQAGNTYGAAAASGDMITGFFNFLNMRPIGAGSGYT